MRTIENLLEGLIYASRWLLAPIYMILCLCLVLIAITTIQHFIQYAPGLMSMKLKEVLLFVLQVVDLALIANLVVMIIFSGYENFISKIDVAKDDRDRPDWMGSVDFSDLKIKLVASILAISGIGLLETFLKIAGSSNSPRRIISSFPLMQSGCIRFIFAFETSNQCSCETSSTT